MDGEDSDVFSELSYAEEGEGSKTHSRKISFVNNPKRSMTMTQPNFMIDDENPENDLELELDEFDDQPNFDGVNTINQ